MKIRRVKKEDYRKIADLRKKTFEKINAKDYSKKKIEQINKKNPPELILEKMKDREMFCLVDNDNILGVIDLKDNKIGGFFIKYNLIRKGLGTKLLRFIEDYASKKEIKKLKLYATKYAYPFYLNHGYKFIQEVDNSRWDSITYEMEKKLKLKDDKH